MNEWNRFISSQWQRQNYTPRQEKPQLKKTRIVCMWKQSKWLLFSWFWCPDGKVANFSRRKIWALEKKNSYTIMHHELWSSKGWLFGGIIILELFFTECQFYFAIKIYLSYLPFKKEGYVKLLRIMGLWKKHKSRRKLIKLFSILKLNGLKMNKTVLGRTQWSHHLIKVKSEFKEKKLNQLSLKDRFLEI